ncbi:MAG: enoyl-CoA hydratase/isomerase family protein [Actinobacteria bacterium]|nr:enoyl-CoA hydratase/isomerase family protein [Actinomycetota bacterium]
MMIEVERRDGGIAVVTLDDPERRNAMTYEAGRALHDAFTDLGEDPDLRVAVLTGAGSAFSAGGDLDMLAEHARRTREEGYDASDAMREFYGLFLSIRELPVPAIAAVNGHAIGAGWCVALACDLDIVAEDAKLGMTFSRIGIHPGMGGSWFLPRMTHRQRAAELLYTGRLVSGADAAGWGLALEAVPADEVLDRSLELAREIAGSAPQVVRQLKRSLLSVHDRSLEEQLDVEAANQAENYGTDDVVEGIQAVRDHRQPRFQGR